MPDWLWVLVYVGGIVLAFVLFRLFTGRWLS